MKFFLRVIKGYEYIIKLDYDDDYAGIYIKYLFLNNGIDCISDNRDENDKSNPYYDFVKKYISKEYSIYDKIINLCDLFPGLKEHL